MDRETRDMMDPGMEACKNHPEKQQIFYLEKMLMEAGYPYFFNMRDDLRGVMGEPDGDPETDIDWNTYNFLIEVGQPAGYGLSMISVCFNQKGDGSLLELLDMRCAADKENPTAEDGELHEDLTAEDCMEIIENFFESLPLREPEERKEQRKTEKTCAAKKEYHDFLIRHPEAEFFIGLVRDLEAAGIPIYFNAEYDADLDEAEEMAAGESRILGTECSIWSYIDELYVEVQTGELTDDQYAPVSASFDGKNFLVWDRASGKEYTDPTREEAFQVFKNYMDGR